MIPHNRVINTRADCEAVDRVIAGGHIAQGPEVEAFEHDMCAYTGRRHAIAVSSGTEALRLAMLAYSGRRVTVPAYSCVALANAAMAARNGVMPVAADVMSGSWTIDPDEIGHDLELDVVVAVNTFGVKSDVLALSEVGARVIEDCTHGFGDHWSDIEVMSCHATKLLGGAGGGVILTGDERVARYVRDLRDYDDKPANCNRLNSKMSDVQAALLRSKLRRLTSMIEERAGIAMMYSAELDGAVGVIRPDVVDRTWYRFTIEVPDADHMLRRLEQFRICAARPVDNWLVKSPPIVPIESAPTAYRAYDHIVSLPCYPGLTKAEVLHVAQCVREVASEFPRETIGQAA
jgi:dTDP-3-amino-3,4,6-trideoxy-alpha-D-glucose transaminase